jgi:hypothetical protein
VSWWKFARKNTKSLLFLEIKIPGNKKLKLKSCGETPGLF